MPVESADKKAVRYLIERRLTVERAGGGDTGWIIASCRGDSGEIYRLGWDPISLEWRCTCPASAQFRRRCSHLRALQSVTVRPSPHTGGQAAATTSSLHAAESHSTGGQD